MNGRRICAAGAVLGLMILGPAPALSAEAAADGAQQADPVPPLPREDICVTFEAGTLQMCMHEFADGTRCVASGGQAGKGAGTAIACDFSPRW